MLLEMTIELLAFVSSPSEFESVKVNQIDTFLRKNMHRVGIC